MKNHRRQTSHGLEINTSKTNSFFHTADLPTPRPPPSISRKISIKQHNAKNNMSNISPPSPSIIPNKLEEQDDLFHHDSYANRLRNLVASTRQALVAPAPSPIPQYLNAKKNHYSMDSPLRSPFDENQIMVDEISSLPTPHPPIEPRHFVFPIQEISVISSDISPSLSNEIPRLSENLKLGDNEIVTKVQPEPMVKSPEANLIGKQIGVYKVIKLLGVGAFSQVYLANHVETNELYAIKTIQKGRLLDDPRVRSSIEREVGVLKVNRVDSQNTHTCRLTPLLVYRSSKYRSFRSNHGDRTYDVYRFRIC